MQIMEPTDLPLHPPIHLYIHLYIQHYIEGGGFPAIMCVLRAVFTSPRGKVGAAAPGFGLPPIPMWLAAGISPGGRGGGMRDSDNRFIESTR